MPDELRNRKTGSSHIGSRISDIEHRISVGRMAKYLVETFGCQMNQHDSERMAGLLEQAGYDRTEDDRDADVIVINTCSVREKAEEKLYTRLGEIRQMGIEEGMRPVVAVTGCV